MLKDTLKISEKLSIQTEEAYKILRSNIMFSIKNKNIKTVSVLSAGHAEGKTVVAINSAISISKTGIKVLLIDADMRKPNTYKHFESNNGVGLSDILSGKAEIEDAVFNTSTSNLHLITSGKAPSHPSEMLETKRFEEVLKYAKENYDFAIIDTPSMGSYIDGAIIASKSDGTIAVIEAKTTDVKSALRFKGQLEKANANVIGVVFNKVSRSDYKDYYSGIYNFSYLKRRWG